MTPYELEQRDTSVPDRVLLDVGGELDLTNASELEERLGDLSAGNGSSLVLDLNRVVFIDSAALHVLFRTARRLGRERFGLVLDPTAPIAKTLSIVGIAEVVTMSRSSEELGDTLPPT
jgi:anti-anti-sigma factor